MPTTDPQYFIENGVHRAVAARENGLQMIPAFLHVPGQAPQRILVALACLHSPKLTISRTDPRHKYQLLESAMATALGRAKIPRIELQPLGIAMQPKSVPLSQVQIQN